MKKIKRKTFVIISTVLDENSARDVQRNINTACVDIESSARCVQWKLNNYSVSQLRHGSYKVNDVSATTFII